MGLLVGFKAMNTFGNERFAAAQGDHQLQEIRGGFETALGTAFPSDNLHRQLIARIHASTIRKNWEQFEIYLAGLSLTRQPTIHSARDCASAARIDSITFEASGTRRPAYEAAVRGSTPGIFQPRGHVFQWHAPGFGHHQFHPEKLEDHHAAEE